MLTHCAVCNRPIWPGTPVIRIYATELVVHRHCFVAYSP